ncbi:MAG: DnaJ domain-containing protein [Deltaproteobacteria bacterium]|jgi:DnaJ-class molecular chaperone|nr:DnaJ domain-containing protein [Deltaproteobacteria bacterium]
MYKDLNLKEGASLDEIKAAYRVMAKTYHPDSPAANGSASAEKFRKAYDAYKGLLRDALDGKTTAGKAGHDLDLELSPYVFSAKRDKGLDVHYDLVLEKPEPLRAVRISLPVTRREACPRCLGQGVTLARKGNGFVYKPVGCHRCEGKGFVSQETEIEITLSPDMLRYGKVRLRNLGAYVPKDGKRGDLVLNLEYVARLPKNN